MFCGYDSPLPYTNSTSQNVDHVTRRFTVILVVKFFLLELCVNYQARYRLLKVPKIVEFPVFMRVHSLSHGSQSIWGLIHRHMVPSLYMMDMRAYFIHVRTHST